MEVKLIDFQVWQDFMPRIGNGGPPLHATLIIEAQNVPGVSASNSGGTVNIMQPNGELIVSAPLRLNEQEDDLGMAQPGARQMGFIMQPAQISVKLKENQMVKATANLKLGDRDATVEVPEAGVTFTH